MHRIFDKFDKELFTGDFVDVQLAGVYQIFEHDGELCFKPYGKTEKVVDYFRNDIIYVEPERGKKMSLVQEYANISCTKEKYLSGIRFSIDIMMQNVPMDLSNSESEELLDEIMKLYDEDFPNHLETYKEVLSNIYSDEELKALIDIHKQYPWLSEKMEAFATAHFNANQQKHLKPMSSKIEQLMDKFYSKKELSD